MEFVPIVHYVFSSVILLDFFNDSLYSVGEEQNTTFRKNMNFSTDHGEIINTLASARSKIFKDLSELQDESNRLVKSKQQKLSAILKEISRLEEQSELVVSERNEIIWDYKAKFKEVIRSSSPGDSNNDEFESLVQELAKYAEKHRIEDLVSDQGFMDAWLNVQPKVNASASEGDFSKRFDEQEKSKNRIVNFRDKVSESLGISNNDHYSFMLITDTSLGGFEYSEELNELALEEKWDHDYSSLRDPRIEFHFSLGMPENTVYATEIFCKMEELAKSIHSNMVTVENFSSNVRIMMNFNKEVVSFFLNDDNQWEVVQYVGDTAHIPFVGMTFEHLGGQAELSKQFEEQKSLRN